MARIYDAADKQELERFLILIAEAALQSNLSLFLGAGSSMQYNAMNWNELIDKVYSGGEDWGNVERAQYAELSGCDVKQEVAKIIASVKIDSNREDTFLSYLLRFDFKSLWTTNYDCVIEQVLEHKKKAYIPIYQYSHFQQLSYPGGQFLYKINGSFNAPETIVITKDDFIDYKRSHEAYLILLKRELLCHSFLFLGCSFTDDILRICIKDILNCVDNSEENYATQHYAVIAERNPDKLDYISKDLITHYNINCLQVNHLGNAYLIAYGIASKVKFSSIFVSGAKSFIRRSRAEADGKAVCQNMVKAFMAEETFPFKFISGMGMSIGHFISGTIKQMCRGKNLNRYLLMEPFPFTSQEANEDHRRNMIGKAGIFIFIYGDYDGDVAKIEGSGMWKEYLYAQKDPDNIIIPLPCGKDSVSRLIYEKEALLEGSFVSQNIALFESFDDRSDSIVFFEELVGKVMLSTRKKLDGIVEEIAYALSGER